MGCSNRIMKKISDLEQVAVLAQRVANLTKVNQIVYKAKCNGIKIFRFSPNWKGKVVRIVRFDRENTSEKVLRNTRNRGLRSTESTKSKIAKESKSK